MSLALAATLLVAFGNVVNAVLRPPLPGGSWIHVALGIALAGATLLLARRAGLTRHELALERFGFGTLVGLAAAALVALPAVVLLQQPPILGQPLRYGPALRVDDATFALHLFVFLPLGAVLPEELAFRGALIGALRRSQPTARAVVLAGVAFAGWHASVIGRTVAETNLDVPAFETLAIVGAAIALVLGGIGFGLLRVWTGSLAAPFAAHWGFNAAVLVGLRAL